jgi:pimeloyl-ACP methyl ester carboxylesterase
LSILLDNRGVRGSTGVVAEDVTAMARDALAFIDGLGLKQIDLLGFSLSVARSTSLGHRNRVLAVPSVSM